MTNFELLCVTMHQKDFSKIKDLNIHSDVVFANQADETSYKELAFDGHTAKMITTATRGVGINRNLALTYASAKYCLFADDDVTYIDNLEETVVSEFEAHPDADVFIFHLDSDDEKRKQKKYSRTRKCRAIEKKPWGACRVAVKLEAVRKANVWFTTLFGGGCLFPSGEDSIWIIDAWKRGLTFYVSDKTIGKVSFDESTWFTGRDEKYYFGAGAVSAALRRTRLWILYFAFRTRNNSKLTFWDRIRWIKKGEAGYKKMMPFDVISDSSKTRGALPDRIQSKGDSL